jgi:hypothetical protein
MIKSVFYYAGRVLQVLGMWLLVVDIFMAGPMGPSPWTFGAGVTVFLAGWGLTRLVMRG